MPDISALFEWLVDAAPGAATAPEVMQRVADGIREGGVPLDRMTLFVSTLHPTVFGRVFEWRHGKAVVVRELPHAFFAQAMFTSSPIAVITSGAGEVRATLAPGPGPRQYPIYDELAAEEFTDYLGLPLVFTTGEVHAVTFTTRNAQGFSDEDVACMRRVMRPLARLAEILALRRTAVNLLSTYVGHNSGERILAGRIQRGDLETVRAVIWFSDLRGFTERSARCTPREVIDALNVAFDCQVGAIKQRGGEVLKFMGDGLLAIFPLGDGPAAATAACDAALEAAEEALRDLAEKSRERDDELRVGLALHVGELAYGNIGAADRLDFTAIGSAVNFASRLEGLTGKLGHSIVVSAEVAAATSRDCASVGEFELKGVPLPATVFRPLTP